MVVEEQCEECELWSGEECLAHLPRSRNRSKWLGKRLVRRPRVPRARVRKGGRRVIVPPVGGKWAQGPGPDDSAFMPPDSGDHGDDAGQHHTDLHPVGPRKHFDWDAEPFEEDVPDWLFDGVGVGEPEFLDSPALAPDEVLAPGVAMEPGVSSIETEPFPQQLTIGPDAAEPLLGSGPLLPGAGVGPDRPLIGPAPVARPDQPDPLGEPDGPGSSPPGHPGS